MKRMNCIAAAALLIAATPTLAKEEPVAVNVERLAPQVAEQVKNHAGEGKTSLIRYLNSTRHIHGLRVEEVLAKRPGGGSDERPR